MKKGFKMLLMCMAVIAPMFLVPFMAKADNKEVKIFVSMLPNNGTNETHLVCGSSMIFSVEINNEKIDKDNVSIDWNVTKKDGTPMQAVYDVIKDGTSLEVYAPYGYPEELEVSACVNGNPALTDTYSFETQENEKMVGKTFFRFDTGEMVDVVTCNEFTEEWNASEQTYTITIPGAVSSDKYVHFLGWKCSQGGYYLEGGKLTIPRKSGAYVLMSAWCKFMNEPSVVVTKVPMNTMAPDVTTTPVITQTPTEEPQESSIPELTEVPAPIRTPEGMDIPELTQIPDVITTSAIVQTSTEEPKESNIPELTEVSVPIRTPEATNMPEKTAASGLSQAPVTTNTPEVTETPKETAASTTISEISKVKKVSKVTVKKEGNRKLKISWSKVSNVRGYRIAYSTNKNFKSNSTKYKTTTAVKATLTKLTKNKTYYVKVCAYKTVNGKKVYSTYSSAKKIILK